MPMVYRSTVVDAEEYPVFSAVSLKPVIARDMMAMEETAERFGLDCTDIHIEQLLACRGCGCTEDRACDGGCYWTPGEKDLCSACKAARKRAPARRGRR